MKPLSDKTDFRPETPFLAADIIIEVEGGIVLIERKNPPHGWAIPGGFVDMGESVTDAAKREAMEETSLELSDLSLFGVYSEPGRDPRFQTVSVVYTAKGVGTPMAADDAKNLQLFSLDSLPPLAFDHEKILDDYRVFLESGKKKK